MRFVVVHYIGYRTGKWLWRCSYQWCHHEFVPVVAAGCFVQGWTVAWTLPGLAQDSYTGVTSLQRWMGDRFWAGHYSWTVGTSYRIVDLFQRQTRIAYPDSVSYTILVTIGMIVALASIPVGC